LISHSNFSKITDDHLSDTNDYKKITNNPLNDVNNHLKETLTELFYDNHILKQSLFGNLCIDDSKLGQFKPQPKLHKKKFGIRPLINSIKHPTSRISLLLHFLLLPFVMKMKSFILDSQNLMQKCNKLTLPKECILISADFESLYTNIDHKHAIEVISDFMKDKLDPKELTPFGFKTLLTLVLENNFFEFDKKYYQQIKGVAMGTNVGPSIANIYIFILETKWLTLYCPILYHRFIDDLLLVILKSHILLIINSFLYLISFR
jgi:hypothetical protein